MLELRVTTIGNSTGVILPREAITRLKVRKGDTLYLTETEDGYKITPYDEKFLRQMKHAEKIMHEDRDVLNALAKA
jgi:putative addiction module antidote